MIPILSRSSHFESARIALVALVAAVFNAGFEAWQDRIRHPAIVTPPSRSSPDLLHVPRDSHHNFILSFRCSLYPPFPHYLVDLSARSFIMAARPSLFTRGLSSLSQSTDANSPSVSSPAEQRDDAKRNLFKTMRPLPTQHYWNVWFDRSVSSCKDT